MQNSNLSPKILAAECALLLNTSVQNIHKKIKDLGLKTQKSQNRVFFTHNESKRLLNLNFSKKTYSFLLVKGGVGKTTAAFHFAIRSALLGAKIALVEIDQQANLTRSCGVDAKNLPVLIDVLNENLNIKDCLVSVCPGLDLLPSRVDNALLDSTLMIGKFPLDKVLHNMSKKLMKDGYDIVIFDCPPSVGAAVSAAALASDIIVMPVNPTDYSIAGLELTYNEIHKLFKQYEKSQKIIKILFNKYDARTNLSFSTMSKLIKHPDYGDKMIQSYIRINQSIENSISSGKSIYDYIRNSSDKEDFSLMTKELLGI